MDSAVHRRKGAHSRDEPSYPRLRRDLRSSPLETADGTAYVVSNPATGRFFRLREVEWFVARQLDGATPPEEIRRRAEQYFAKELPPATLAAFLERARTLGLFEAANDSGRNDGGKGRHEHRHGRQHAAEPTTPTPPPVTDAAADTGRGRLRGDPLYLRFKAFDPQRQIDWLLPKLRFCFTPGFVAAVLALALAAGFVAVDRWAQLREEFARLYQWQTVVYAWLALLVTVSAHEFAHGLACAHFGGRVREMGMMLIYFQPAVYCNVSEAWLIPEKRRRIWVGAAGPFLDLLQWAVAMLLWRITEVDTAAHSIALIVAATTVARTLLNINPLLKLDAYYVLADAVGIPNLRRRAFAYLHGLWSRQASGSAEASPRERRIFLAYGVAAAIYSVALLGYVGAWIGGYLIDRYHTLGLLLFAGLGLLIFRRPLGERRRALAERLTRRLPSFAALRPRLALALPAALGLALLLPFPFTAGGNFTALPPGGNGDVRAEVAGIVEAVFVDEGQSIAAGAPIARLANHDRTAELGQVEAAIREKQARLKMLRSGTRPEDIAIARQKLATAATRESEARSRLAEERRLHAARLVAAEAGVTKAQEQMQYAVDKYALMEPLADVVSPLELREARAEAAIRRKALEESQAGLQFVRGQNQQALRETLAVAAATHREAESELQLLLAGSRPEEIEAVEAEIASLETRAADLRDRIARATIRAPRAGVVTTPRLREAVGQRLESGSLLATVHDLRRISAEIAVSERDIGDVRVGQPVKLRVRAYPTETFAGRVVGIAPATAAAEHPGAPRIVRVITEIDNPEGRIKSDMTGYAKIGLGPRPLFEILGHDLFASLGVEFWSWW